MANTEFATLSETSHAVIISLFLLLEGSLFSLGDVFLIFFEEYPCVFRK